MRIFPLDIGAGIFLAISLILIIIGFLAYRHRRGSGPLFMSLAGILGLISSVLWLLLSLDILAFPATMVLLPFILSLLLFMASLIRWRASDEG